MQVVNPALVQSALNQLFGVSLVKLGYRLPGECWAIVLLVSWLAFYCRLLIHGGAYPALVHRLAIRLLFKSATVSDLDTGASAGYSLVLGLLVNLAYRWCLPALVTCEILLKKPIQPIAKHYAKWYDFAYILNQEGLKNQGVKNMGGVIDG